MEDDGFLHSLSSRPSQVTVHMRKQGDIDIHDKCTRSTLNILNESHLNIKEEEERSRTLKATKTLSIVYGCFMVCWLPVSVLAIGLAWSHTTFSTIQTWPHVLLAEILPVFNSMMNPIIYSLKHKAYLKALRKMVNESGNRLRDYIRQ